VVELLKYPTVPFIETGRGESGDAENVADKELSPRGGPFEAKAP